MSSQNPWVFVTGCTRSGTTLLQRMLDNHPRLAVSNDTHVIPRSILSAHPAHDIPLTKQLVEEVTNYKYFHKLGIDLSVARRLARSAETFVELACALFDEFAHRQGKPLAGEKDPEYVRRLPLLHHLFPAARILHIIRDGRDVALSTLEWVTPHRYLGRLPLWEEEPIAVCALWWRRQVSAGVRGGEVVEPDRYLEVRYEALVDATELTMRSITEFLGLPFESSVLEYHSGKTRFDSGLSSKDQWLPPTSGLRDWRTQLSRRDLQLFEVLAGDLLTALGYPLAAETPVPRDVMASAERCEARWRSEVERPTPARSER